MRVILSVSGAWRRLSFRRYSGPVTTTERGEQVGTGERRGARGAGGGERGEEAGDAHQEAWPRGPGGGADRVSPAAPGRARRPPCRPRPGTRLLKTPLTSR